MSTIYVVEGTKEFASGASRVVRRKVFTSEQTAKEHAERTEEELNAITLPCTFTFRVYAVELDERT